MISVVMSEGRSPATIKIFTNRILWSRGVWQVKRAKKTTGQCTLVLAASVSLFPWVQSNHEIIYPEEGFQRLSYLATLSFLWFIKRAILTS
ncbi:hypothetical protein ARMGADRAFT_440079 [Armillaria gallica]|uniref:Uncharacterized protein n=1 Tax=Armillaria gallica TaxID=47427 RepID=A0A2H3CYB4_ARMGA|nr:hypothetical protein ARMGADRAFT_440079 [Armillaria gallica]